MKMTGVASRMGTRYANDQERWGAVVSRDPAADGSFYYSVKTTGVYCRPSCNSRSPLREHVQFHDSSEEAERAGFRACKRCRPNGPALEDEYAEKVARACRAIEGAETLPTLNELARLAGMSRFHFHRIFTRFTGLTPKAYAQAQRAERLRRGLSARNTVTEALYESGFNSSGRFYAESSRILGMKPTQFRKGGSGEKIQFSVNPCSLGYVLAAASQKGVCAIFLGDAPEKLRAELKARFREALLIPADRGFDRTVKAVLRLVETPAASLSLPLDIRGTAFQQRVWRALAEIPPGCTANYSEIARQIGSPKAVRAVASACASNSIALAIPCHRVVRATGELAGYRWGVERKRALLERERRSSKVR
ncbi:MAG TPA: bifunctional DNA-binding transcriptional regulator/O6-methylguanine-DNA methyltransferase Ada [Verrucomicrobiae bacterium]|nr:bifunctional DNA-binding transcriptional regulator/O6-methylguanine-DNA methyltransferase Ada [Verrucomicrobiae bacterium]